MSNEQESIFPLTHPDVEVGAAFILESAASKTKAQAMMQSSSIHIRLVNPVLATYIDTGQSYYIDNKPSSVSGVFVFCNVLGYKVLSAALIRGTGRNLLLPRLDQVDIERGVKATLQLPEQSFMKTQTLIQRLKRMAFSEKQAVDAAYDDTDEGVQIVNLGQEGIRKTLAYLASKEPALNGLLHWGFGPESNYEVPLTDRTDVLEFDSFREVDRMGILTVLDIYKMFALKLSH